MESLTQVGEKTPPGTLKRDRPKSSCKTWYDQYSQVKLNPATRREMENPFRRSSPKPSTHQHWTCPLSETR